MTIEDVATYFIFISNNSSYSSCLNCTGKVCRNSLINSMKLHCIKCGNPTPSCTGWIA